MWDVFNVKFFVFKHFVKISGEHMAKYWVGGRSLFLIR